MTVVHLSIDGTDSQFWCLIPEDRHGCVASVATSVRSSVLEAFRAEFVGDLSMDEITIVPGPQLRSYSAHKCGKMSVVLEDLILLSFPKNLISKSLVRMLLQSRSRPQAGGSFLEEA